jgi:hypothetical protein
LDGGEKSRNVEGIKKYLSGNIPVTSRVERRLGEKNRMLQDVEDG